MKKLNNHQKRQWLIAKGYESARTGDQKLIEALYGLYHKSERPLRTEPKQWKMWGGTRRLHHYG